jgi:hypothetical protein
MKTFVAISLFAFFGAGFCLQMVLDRTDCGKPLKSVRQRKNRN